MTKPDLYFGIEVGGTKLQIVVGNGLGMISQRYRLAVQPRQGGAGIRRQIELAVTELLRRFDPQAVGVGFGGPVDWRTGKVCCSHQIEGWSSFELGDWLQSLTQKPSFVDNDANVGALGEAFCGAGIGCNPVFYITLGSGVGGGLVVEKRIYHGAKPGESEIGHVRLDRQGTILESRCSGWSVDKRIRELTHSFPDSPLAQAIGQAPGGEAKHLLPALAQGDPMAHRILTEVTEDLGFGLSHVVHLVHPEVIVLGGGLSLVGEPLRAGVEAALSRSVMDAFSPGPLVVLARLGEDSVPVGTLILASQHFEADTPLVNA